MRPAGFQPADDSDTAGGTPAGHTGSKPVLQAPRPPGDDGEVMVVQKAGCMVGQRGGEFTVSEKGTTLQIFPMHQMRAIYLYGAVQLTAHRGQ